MKVKARKLRDRIIEQRKWIENCESNGVSYADTTPSQIKPGLTRGDAIRQADLDHLSLMEHELKQLNAEAGEDLSLMDYNDYRRCRQRLRCYEPLDYIQLESVKNDLVKCEEGEKYYQDALAAIKNANDKVNILLRYVARLNGFDD